MSRERILRTLADKPVGMYTLEMLAADPSLKRSTIYATLGRLVEDGLVESRPAGPEQPGGLRRRLFRLTEQGRRAATPTKSD